MSITPGPSVKTDIFNNSYWLDESGESLTVDEANKMYLKYPVAQGTETMTNVVVNGYIQFGDGTQQSTSSVVDTIVPDPSGSYSDPSSIVVNSKGQVTYCVSGSSSALRPIKIVSNGSSVNSWVINTTGLTGNYYQFYLYSTNGFASGSVTAYVDGSGIDTPNNVGLVLSGLLAKVPVTYTTGNRITYCAGYQQNYNWSKDVYGYLASNINNYTTVVDIESKILGVVENEGTCPPTPGTWSGCQLNIAVKSGYVNLSSASTLTMVCFPL